MSTENVAPIDIVGLREKLSKLTYDKLKEEATALGVESVWKGGVNKQTAVENIIKAYVAKTELENPVKPTEEITVIESEEKIDTPEESIEEIPEGEYDIDEDTLIEYPVLIEMGFAIGDVLIVEVGKPWSKKDLSDGTDGISTTKTIEEVDKEIKDLNGGKEYDENLLQDSINTKPPVDETDEEDEEEKPIEEIEVEEEVETGEYVPEVIDESKYSIEDLEENIQICQANCYQALPATRIHLLRKIDALQLALDRKQK